MTKEQNDQLLTEIAKKHLSLETLETRNSDSLDFHDMAVWAIKDALQEALCWLDPSPLRNALVI